MRTALLTPLLLKAVGPSASDVRWWKEVRIYLLIVLFLLPAGLPAAATSLSPSDREEPIFVRVNKPDVHFRKWLPQTQERQDIEIYADPKATYIAYDRKHGEVAGYSGDWFWLVNNARDEERGWVAASYVEVIDPADEARLNQLGTSPEKSDSFWLQLWDNVAGIINSLLGIAAAIISIVTSKWLVKKFVKHLGKVRSGEQAKVDASPSREAGPFPRAVPKLPLTRGPSSRREPSVIYGGSREAFWIHRTTKRRQQ